MTTPTFPMAEFSATVTSLLGRTSQDPKLQTFLEALGHWPLPRFGKEEWTLYAKSKPLGYCLHFREAAAPEGSKMRIPLLEGCYLYSEGHEGYRAFSHPMPKGITWSDSSASLLARLGPPSSGIRSKKTGKLTSERWLGADKANDPYVAAGYVDDGARLEDVFVGRLPGARPVGPDDPLFPV